MGCMRGARQYHGTTYIRTDSNRTAVDYLGNLPTFYPYNEKGCSDTEGGPITLRSWASQPATRCYPSHSCSTNVPSLKNERF